MSIFHNYCGSDFCEIPLLVGMIVLFAFEFIEGNTITKRYLIRRRRMTKDALKKGAVMAELESERAKLAPTFTHYLDLPILFVIIAVGALRPTTWAVFLYGTAIAVCIATVLTVVVPRMYPWGIEAA
jgi:hypothetical protein